jgi:hypothetical protein
MLSRIGLTAQLERISKVAIQLTPSRTELMGSLCSMVHWKLRKPEKGLSVGSPAFKKPAYAQGMPSEWLATESVPSELLKASLEADGEPVDNHPHLHPQRCHYEMKRTIHSPQQHTHLLRRPKPPTHHFPRQHLPLLRRPHRRPGHKSQLPRHNAPTSASSNTPCDASYPQSKRPCAHSFTDCETPPLGFPALTARIHGRGTGGQDPGACWDVVSFRRGRGDAQGCGFRFSG